MILSILALLTLSAPEARSATEQEDISAITQIIDGMVRKQFEGDGVAHRDAHAKQHGCVKAVFQAYGGLAPNLAVGVFADTTAHPAWIRFSNGSGASQDDSVGDGRGMAVKVMGIDGPKLLEDERDARTQDFVMINHPTFFVKNAADYVEFQRQVSEKGLDGLKDFFFPSWKPWAWRWSEFRVANAIRGKEVSSPLGTPYFSMTPYLLGERQVIKYSASPCFSNPPVPTRREGPDFLRENLWLDLSQGTRCFDFKVQLRSHPSSMPIDDPTVEWDESESAFVPVARITIPGGSEPNWADEKFCENLSMTPWHSLPEHEPVGSINRVRKVVYQHVSRLRHELNGEVRQEPNE